MKITFHGAARTVTGSQHLLEINGYRLLLECGLFQGRRQDTYERNRNFLHNPRKLDAVILTHAHIDHSGNLPNLVKSGYEGPIYTTTPTAHLANIMLMDSGHIQELDVQYINKKRLRKGEPPFEPLYTLEDAAAVAQYFVGVPYNEEFEPLPGVRARLVEAGHILGSAQVILDIEDHQQKYRLWFSGDIGRPGLPLIKDPVLPQDADYLIMESTYGDKPHRDPELAFQELRQVVARTLQRGGKVIIPAFAVGRTQELVYDLHKLIDAREIPSVPVIVDSPLAINVTEIFRRHTDYLDEEAREFVRTNRQHEIFGFDLLKYTRSVEDSKALNDRDDPMIIISASGMAESGRILHHLKNNIGNPRNTILIVSWQAPETLGRRIADREERVKIFGEVYERRAEVATIGGLSAHAGQVQLLNYAEAARGSARRIFLVHGEPRAANALMEEMVKIDIPQVSYPELHQSVEV